MAETLLVFQKLVAAPDGTLHEARACAAPDAVGMWQGWIEFVPLDGGPALRSPRETTQPNRADTVYWATGLTPIYLEGALRRALEPPPVVQSSTLPAAIFDEPAPPKSPNHQIAKSQDEGDAVLDPFSVYRKGEALLRRQLAALSAWHLVNIAVEYELTGVDVATLNAMTPQQLIETIVAGVKASIETARTR